MTWVRAARWAKTFELTPALPHRPMILQGRRTACRLAAQPSDHSEDLSERLISLFRARQAPSAGRRADLEERVFAMIEEQLGGD